MRITEHAAGRWRFESLGELIGYDGENNAWKINIEIGAGVTAEAWDWYADFEYADGSKATLPLAVGDTALTANVSAGYLIPGQAVMQLRALSGTTIRKTNVDMVRIEQSINATDELDAPTGTMWDEYASQVAQMRDAAQAAARTAEDEADRAEEAAQRGPYIGDGGYWYVWDSTAGEYKNSGQFSGGEAPYIGSNGNWYIGAEDSGVSATGPKGDTGATGSPGQAATVVVGTVTTGNPGTSAIVTNSGTNTAAVLNFTIPQGPRGETGQTGQTGAAGQAATIEIGTVTTGAAGTNASVTNSGDSSNAVLNFTIPQGPRGQTGATGQTGAAGQAATITIGTVTTGATGADAEVTNSGTNTDAVLNFTIPRGERGETGQTGAAGSDGQAATIKIGTVTTGDADTDASVTNSGTDNAAVLNFTIPRGERGETGQTGQTGAAGQAATIKVGTVTTGDAGTDAAVTNSGTTSAAVLNFTIPRGAAGSDGVSVTDVTQTTTSTADGGTNTVRVSTSDGKTYDFNVRNGSRGSQGPQGIQGPAGADGTSFTVNGRYDTLAALKSAHATGTAGEAYAVGTVDENIIYVWSEDDGDWTALGSLQGPQGPAGQAGADGKAATVAIGTVTTGNPGTSATVTNSGTENAAVLNFTIPRGQTGATGAMGQTGATGPAGSDGKAATITIGKITTGAAGSDATVTNSGTDNAAVLDFVIPRGATGQTGQTGAAGSDGQAATIKVGTVSTGNPGTSATVTNSGTTNAAVLDFVIPRGATGAAGAAGADGKAGSDGVSVTKVEQITTSTADGGTNTVRVTLSNGNYFDFDIRNGSKGSTGQTGAAGSDGQQGPAGADGKAATIEIGKVTTESGTTSPGVTNSGTSNAAILDFVLPRGATGQTGAQGPTGSDGQAATITIGTVTTGAAGSDATVTNTGTDNAAVLNFTIPRGATGATGSQGEAGPNTVSTSTSTNISGLLKGNGSKVSAAQSGTDYVTPTLLIQTVGRGNKVTEANVDYTTYMARGIALVSADADEVTPANGQIVFYYTE